MIKNIQLLIVISLFGAYAFGQTTATNFSVNDCSGTPYNLFDKLDAGKVVVIAWPMPCFTCIAPTIAAHDAANSFATSNPGEVEFYMVDDYGDTDCGTLNGWAGANGFTNVTAFFSNADIAMSDYGVDGMPKVVVLGCSDHKIFFNKNDNIDYNQVQASITSALAGTGCAASNIEEQEDLLSALSLFPNPASNQITLTYTLHQTSQVSIQIFSNSGALVKSINENEIPSGKISQSIDILDLQEGIYYMRIMTENFVQTERFIINK